MMASYVVRDVPPFTYANHRAHGPAAKGAIVRAIASLCGASGIGQPMIYNPVMKHRKKATLLARALSALGLLAGLACGVSLASAQTEEPSGPAFFVELEGGAEYDSVVAIDELDLSGEEGDTLLVLDARVGYSQALGDDAQFDLSYSYSALDYQEFSQVDQNSHVVSADFTKDLENVDIGLAGIYVNSDLDNELFLELGRISPYVMGLIAKSWFARGAVVYSDKANDVNPGRDATAFIGELDLYHFPTGKPWFLNFGYKYRDENARAARFDYTGNTYKARYVHRLSVLERPARLELAYRRLDRDYSSPTPSIGEERFDQRDRIGALLEVTIKPALFFELYYNYSDWDSNLESVNFQQDLAGVRLRYRMDR